MDIKPVPNRVTVVLIGLLVVLTPILLLSLTLLFLSRIGDVFVSQLTLVELFELYLIELVLLTAAGYLLYRLVLRLVVHDLPESLDAIARERAGDDDDRPER